MPAARTHSRALFSTGSRLVFALCVGGLARACCFVPLDLLVRAFVELCKRKCPRRLCTKTRMCWSSRTSIPRSLPRVLACSCALTRLLHISPVHCSQPYPTHALCPTPVPLFIPNLTGPDPLPPHTKKARKPDPAASSDGGTPRDPGDLAGDCSNVCDSLPFCCRSAASLPSRHHSHP
jgi:hypothetical protein